jgi:hypothetical protein
MPPRIHVVAVEVHVVDRRTSIWCDQCALPSVVEADLALVKTADLAVIGRGTVWACPDCGRSGHRGTRPWSQP